MGFIKDNYGEEAENQVAWNSALGGGVLGNIFLYILFKDIITSIKKNLNKLRQKIR